jgi:hypothetical protein
MSTLLLDVHVLLALTDPAHAIAGVRAALEIIPTIG